MYEPRIYRDKMGRERFYTFTVTHLETDLWIAVDRESYQQQMEDAVLKEILSLRNKIEVYASHHPEFIHALTPLDRQKGATSDIVNKMMNASEQTGIGPMSAVA